MGMFDIVIYKNREYQTKDLGCFLDTHTINKKTLFFDSKYIDTHQRYHGYLHTIRVDDGKYFRFKFTNGKLVKIEETEGRYKKVKG